MNQKIDSADAHWRRGASLSPACGSRLRRDGVPARLATEQFVRLSVTSHFNGATSSGSADRRAREHRLLRQIW